MQGRLIEVVPERPVAGGRMLARLDGRVVLVGGALPGERVRARVERISRQVIWADVVDVIEPSSDRRPPAFEPSCGGCLYAHVRYERQLQLKSEIVADAFRRIAKRRLDSPVPIEPSPERGYRLRARLHAEGGLFGFFREGTHALCDAGPTGQLAPEATAAIAALWTAMPARTAGPAAIVLCENVTATERVLHVESVAPLPAAAMAAWSAGVAGATGISVGPPGRVEPIAGSPTVTDSAADLFGAESPVAPDVRWTRRAPAFFQSNRFLAGALARRVIDAADGRARVADLYAGVGLFAVALAAGGAEVTAVEGDPVGAADLSANAAPWQPRLRVVHGSVEEVAAMRPAEMPDAIVLDPPRTGVSAAALVQLLGWEVPRLIYVSCDPPTLARDAAACFQAGYRLTSLQGFDLFPTTPHVEVVAVFDR